MLSKLHLRVDSVPGPACLEWALHKVSQLSCASKKRQLAKEGAFAPKLSFGYR